MPWVQLNSHYCTQVCFCSTSPPKNEWAIPLLHQIFVYLLMKISCLCYCGSVVVQLLDDHWITASTQEKNKCKKEANRISRKREDAWVICVEEDRSGSWITETVEIRKRTLRTISREMGERKICPRPWVPSWWGSDLTAGGVVECQIWQCSRSSIASADYCLSHIRSSDPSEEDGSTPSNMSTNGKWNLYVCGKKGNCSFNLKTMNFFTLVK